MIQPCDMSSIISSETRSNQVMDCFVSPTLRHSSPTRYVRTALSALATPSYLESACSNICAACLRKKRSASMSPSSTQHQAALSSRSAICLSSSPCHSATLAAASYLPEPVAENVTLGASSLSTCSLRSGLSSPSWLKSLSPPEKPHSLHM